MDGWMARTKEGGYNNDKYIMDGCMGVGWNTLSHGDNPEIRSRWMTSMMIETKLIGTINGERIIDWLTNDANQASVFIDGWMIDWDADEWVTKGGYWIMMEWYESDDEWIDEWNDNRKGVCLFVCLLCLKCMYMVINRFLSERMIYPYTWMNMNEWIFDIYIWSLPCYRIIYWYDWWCMSMNEYMLIDWRHGWMSER